MHSSPPNDCSATSLFRSAYAWTVTSAKVLLSVGAIVALVVMLDRFVATPAQQKQSSASRLIPLSEEFVIHAAFDAKQRTLGTISATGRVGLYPLSSEGEPRLGIGDPNKPAYRLAFDPGRPRLAIGYLDGSIHVWDTHDRRLLVAWDGVATEITSMEYSPDGETLALATNDGRVVFRSVPPGRRATLVVRTPDSYPRKIAYSPTGDFLACGDAEGGVYLWNTATGKPLRSPQRHKRAALALAFSADGSRLASGSPGDSIVHLWDVRSSIPLQSLEPPNDGVSSLAFSPGSSLLASGHTSGAVRVWDLTTRTVQSARQDGTDWVIALAWCGDSRSLFAAGHGDDPARSWIIATAPPLTGAPSRAHALPIPND